MQIIVTSCFECANVIQSEVYYDELGPHVICQVCGSSQDVDVPSEN